MKLQKGEIILFECHNDDILNTKAQVIAHQVNCLGVMGAGVAKAIRDKYPAAYLQYKRLCSEPFDPLGACQMAKTEDGYVANLFGQYGIAARPTPANRRITRR